TGGNEKVRPNKWTASALLARVYLYKEEWQKADAEANAVINSGMYSMTSNLNNVFLKNSTEAIWQLQPVNVAWNTWEGKDVLFATGSTPPTYYISNVLLNSFEPADARKTSWIGSRNYLGQQFFYPYKYKVYGNNAPVTEYYMVFRLGEQFLIRAEARMMQDNLMGAESDINTIRTRAGLANITFSNKAAAIIAIENERRHELFAEWGHRWFDLKRTNRADGVIGALKPATWQSTDELWPIPISQINANPFLTQNPGY
ncbi:MAG: RagB/SusD family nutrient uptake outer membrane protein, partial [Patescibacteria group bacterium]